MKLYLTLIRNIKKKFKFILMQFSKSLIPELFDLKYLLGQAAILSSRSNSHTFKNLWDAEVKVFSQWGEDGILDYLCEKTRISKPNIIEIGAGNFTECNSRFIAEFRNANVIAVDARDDLAKVIESSNLYWKTNLVPIVEWVTPDNINDIMQLGKAKFGRTDIFSLDLDGNDYWILNNTDLSDVTIVVAEYNPIFGSKLKVTVPRKDNFDRYIEHYSGLYYGASLCAYIDLLSARDFHFIGTNRVGNNACFIQSKYVNEFNFEIKSEYEKFADWRIRESRDQKGNLTYLSTNERLQAINELPLLDLSTMQTHSIKKLFSLKV